MSWPSTFLPSQAWPSQEISRVPLLVIYSARTGRVRRIISDDTLNVSIGYLQAQFPPGTGEAAQVLVGSTDVQLDLTQGTGLIPTGDRYVALDANGIVQNALIGDPDCGDSVQDLTLVAHATARMAWRQKLDSSWQRSIPEIDHDIVIQNNMITYLNSQAFIDRETANGLTTAQIDAKREDDLAAVDTQITILNVERDARTAPR